MEIWGFRVRVAPRYHNSTHLGRSFSQSSTSSRSLVKSLKHDPNFHRADINKVCHSKTFSDTPPWLRNPPEDDDDIAIASKPTQDLDLEWIRSLKHLIYTPNGVEMYCTDQASSLLWCTRKRFVVVQDYLDTCNRLLDLEPKVIVPAHGKPNLWPANMLHTYIK